MQKLREFCEHKIRPKAIMIEEDFLDKISLLFNNRLYVIRGYSWHIRSMFLLTWNSQGFLPISFFLLGRKDLEAQSIQHFVHMLQMYVVFSTLL